MPKIRKLPPDAIRILQSGVVITDATQCVLELVYNSIDAQATAIIIHIDLKKYKISVTDNGEGLSKEDLTNFGERFMTSKYDSYFNSNGFTTYGYRGQAISSMLAVCKRLKIETKTKRNESTFKKVFEEKLSLPVTIDLKVRESGTTITVEDFMYSMPVRRKRINEVFDLEEMKTQLKYLAVIHHKVSFLLRNENKCSVVFQSQGASNILSSVSNIFGESFAKNLMSVAQRHKDYQIAGLVSKKLEIFNNIQLLYVNKRLIAKGMTHKLLSNIMKKYASKADLSPPSSAIYEHECPLLNKYKRSPCRSFILEINCPVSCYELYTNMRKCTVEFKVWKDIIKALQKGIKRAFCVEENLSINSLEIIKKTRKNEKDPNRGRRKRGTSLLVNAIKGAPVTRQGKVQQLKQNYEKREITENDLSYDIASFSGLIEKIRKVEDPHAKERRRKVDSAQQNVFKVEMEPFIDETIDSSESPTPKKKFKVSNHKDMSRLDKFSYQLNQSFFMFYKWLKKQMKNEMSAFKLYQSFLRFKKRQGNSNDFIFSKKFKRPKIFGLLSNEMSAADKSPELVSKPWEINRNALMISTFDQPKENDFFESNRKGCSHIDESFAFPKENHCENVDQPKYALLTPDQPILNLKNSIMKFDEKQILWGAEEIPKFLDQSDVFFSNYMEFRNFSDSFECRFSPKEKLKTSNDFANLQTWTSHREKRLPGNSDRNPFISKSGYNDSSLVKYLRNEKETRTSREPDFFLNWNNLDKPLFSTNDKMRNSFISNERNALLSKRDATVQTEFTDSLPQPKNIESNESETEAYGEILNVVEAEVPVSDFWNQFVNRKLEKEATTSKERNNLKSPDNRDTGKITSERLIMACNQEKDGATDAASISSKDSISMIWTDTLSRLKRSSGQGSKQQFDVTQMTQTASVEHIDLDSLKSDTSRFRLTSRPNCLPKGLSPVLPRIESSEMAKLTPGKKSKINSLVHNGENEFLSSVKWQDASGGTSKPGIPNGILDEMRQKAEKNMINCKSGILSASLSYCAIKVHNLLHSFAFTKELLSGVEIIGQLDKKFIVAKMRVFAPKKMELITLFDQHAVDERIKLEKILNDNVLSDGRILSAGLNPAIECKMDESSVQLLSSSSDKFLSLGFSCNVLDEKTVVFEEIPAFLADKYDKDINNKNYAFIKKIVVNLIFDAVNELTESRGALSQIPKILYNLFCSEACHKAIRFNKPLTKNDMAEMVNKLKDCRLPFQCAHGRPSVIPIIDLEDFYESMTDGGDEISREKLEKFTSSKNRLNSFGNSNFG